MLDALMKALETILTILLLPIALMYTWIIKPFLAMSSEDGLITAVMTYVVCALPIILFIRWRVRLHRRKKYWQERIYQDEPMTINEQKQMEAETYDALADFLTHFGPHW